MAYQVDKFNGTFLTSVEDGTIDTTTDIRFVGKNYAGYGEVQNENFLHMLEHFANTTSPPKAVPGQIWYDSGNKRLKFYDGTKWKLANGAQSGTTAPSGLDTGEFWWDTAAKQLYIWSGTEFILVGPEASPDLGASAIEAEVVRDDNNVPHTILKAYASGKVVAVLSKDTFTLSEDDLFADFTLIKAGWTLAGVNTSGVSEDFVYWGTSSNALKLGGIDYTNYLQKGAINFSESIHFQNDGYTLGSPISSTADLKVYIKADEDIYFESRLGNPINFRIITGGEERDIAKVTSTSFEPGSNSSYDLGSTSNAWNNVYASTLRGALIGNVTGNSTGDHTGNLRADDAEILVNGSTKVIGYAGANLQGILTGSVVGDITGKSTSADTLISIAPSTALPTTTDKTSVPLRSSSGSITATQFIGIADKSDKLKLGVDYVSSSTAKVANTIAARDASGDISANYFRGTATAAQYADLAEKYTTDQEYVPGTVVSVCDHEDHEVEACTAGDRALGVVSTNPAYMMNSEAEGQYIALKGRVPCKVGGKVKKGDRLVAGGNGYAVVGSGENVFGIALESNDQEGVKLIEAVVL